MKTKKLAALILFLTLTVGMGASARGADDISGHWAADIINYSISTGHVSGYSDGTFRPDSPVKRSEFVALANRYMGFTQATISLFSDVRQGDWFYNDVGAAVREGYVSGYPDGTFRPNAPITRETAAVMAANMLHLSPKAEYASYFTDGGNMSWSKDMVGAAVKAKLISGYTSGEFRPEQALTRAEAVALLSAVSGKRYDTSLETAYGYQSYYTNSANNDSGYIPEDRLNYQNEGISSTTSPDRDGYYRIYNGNYGTDGDKEEFYGNVQYDPKYAGTVRNIYVSGNFELTYNINADSELTLQDVTIRGKLIIYGIGKVTLKNCDINQIEYRSDRSGAEIYASSGTTVRETRVFRSVKLIQETTTDRGFRSVYMDESCRQRDTLRLSGDISYVNVNGRKAYLVVEKGTVETVEIAEKSEECDGEVKSGAIVNYMDVRSGCYVHGSGRIKQAKISANNAEFDLIPDSVTGSRNPVYTDTATGGSSSNGSNTHSVVIIVESSGVPQQGVSVTLGEFGEVYTGSTGKASFSGVSKGTYECLLSAPNAKTMTVEIIVSDRDINRQVEYDPTPKYNATITVRLNGSAVQLAVVNLGSKTLETDAGGRAVFTDLNSGVYDCSASYKDAAGDVYTGMTTVDIDITNTSKTINLAK